MDLGKEEEDKGQMEAGLSPQSHLKTFPALLSIWNHVSFPFIAISALPDLDDCPMLVLPEIPNISGVIHLSLDKSGAGLGGGRPKNPNTKGWRDLKSLLEPQTEQNSIPWLFHQELE